MTEIIVPPLGESVTEATVGKWFKSVGGHVERDDVLVELETDKVTVEISADHAGTLQEILVTTGNTVSIGTVLGALGGGDNAVNRDTEIKNKVQKPVKKTDSDVSPMPEASGGNAEEQSVKAGTDMALIPVVAPDMGESVGSGTIAGLLKQVGDFVARDETIASIETEKVALDIPASDNGVLAEWLIAEGDSVTPGAVVARIKTTPHKTANAPSGMELPPMQQQQSTKSGKLVVLPSVRRIAAEAGIDPGDIPGTGRDGRVTKADALAYVKKNTDTTDREPDALAVANIKPVEGTLSQQVQLESSELSEVLPNEPREKRVRMTRLRQTIARRLKESQNTAAMLTTFNDVDMSAVMAMRERYKDHFLEKHGVKLGFMGLFSKAVVSALKEVPVVNAEIDGNDIIYKNYHNIGIAVASDKGLVVPVIRDCDILSIAEIEIAIGEMGKKARNGSLAIADMQGASFTITNGGVFGSLLSTPILNPPQSGVLGMHRIERRPVARGEKVVIRPMMYLALSYDHRIIDGKEAVTFLVHVKQALEAPERMLLNI